LGPIAHSRHRDLPWKGTGGQFEGSIDEEIRILQFAIENGARFVDIDYRFVQAIPEPSHCFVPRLRRNADPIS
jgi:hypothetical protein